MSKVCLSTNYLGFILINRSKLDYIYLKLHRHWFWINVFFSQQMFRHHQKWPLLFDFDSDVTKKRWNLLFPQKGNFQSWSHELVSLFPFSRISVSVRIFDIFQSFITLKIQATIPNGMLFARCSSVFNICHCYMCALYNSLFSLGICTNIIWHLHLLLQNYRRFNTVHGKNLPNKCCFNFFTLSHVQWQDS